MSWRTWLLDARAARVLKALCGVLLIQENFGAPGNQGASWNVQLEQSVPSP